MVFLRSPFGSEAEIKNRVMSSMLYEPPLITEPPQTSYPDPLEMPFWYSDLRVRYPSSQEVISTSNHQTFKAYLEFWAIFNDIASVSFPPGRDRSFSLSQAVDFYARSRSWFEGLPNDLQPGKIVLPCQLKLQYVINFCSSCFLIASVFNIGFF